MFITIMKSKIYSATVQDADVRSEGSITIDVDLMERANIYRGEKVQIVNLSNGERLETYTIPGKRGTGIIAMNGPAALKCVKGDVIHIISYALLEPNKATTFQPKTLHLDKDNRVQQEIDH
ncbi:MAG: aspartate 1-decarboxylase [Calditrichaeota bacterium]|nr:MAG: aspartate 1-decarboxylase [Calditrichota bacterium]